MEPNRFEYDCAVIGAGPAGMMAAGRAALAGGRVLLCDKNAAPGRKLGITGKGRCNITNNCGTRELLENIRGGKFLYSAFSRFSPADVMAFFEGLGVPLKTERGGRVFPESDRAADVAAALKKFANDSGAAFKTAEIRAVHPLAGGGFLVVSGGEKLRARTVIVATGGLSYPKTGSTGDGYAFARAFGHKIAPTRPSLVGLSCPDRLCRECAGLTLKNIGLSLYEDGKRIFSDFGELLFTHEGVSGPLALRASAHMARPGAAYSIAIDLKPALSPETLDKRLLADFGAAKNKMFKNALDGLLPAALRGPVVEKSGIPPELPANSVTREQRRALCGLLKDLRLADAAPGPMEGAVVTAGGVELREIDPGTMESKLCPGLYFAGEVLNADGYTGGFNLQIAFSTGFCAGEAAGAAGKNCER